MELRRATKKLLSDSNLRLLSNLIISLSNTTTSVQERCVEPYEDGKVYQAGVSLVLKDSELYFCKVTNQDATWTPSHWELIGKDITEIDLDTVKSWLNLSQDEIDNLQNLIDDTTITTTKTNSSSKIYMDIQAAIAECKDDTLKQIAKKVSGSYKIAASTSEVTSADFIYLISNGANYDLYVLVDSVPTRVGDTTIDLSDYAKLTDLADYLKKTDATSTYATITTVDGKVDKTNILASTSTAATDDQVYSAKAINTELDGVVKKTDISTTIDSTSTNDTVPTNKAVYDSLINKVNNTIVLNTADEVNSFDRAYQSFVIGPSAAESVGLPKAPDSTWFCINLSHVKGFKYPSQIAFEYAGIERIMYRTAHNGVWHNWRKIPTTSVADVAKTALKNTSTSYPNDTNSYYTVKNGWCQVSLSFKCATAETNLVDVLTLPKPKMLTYAYGFPRNINIDVSKAPVFIFLTEDGVLQMAYGSGDGTAYRCSFSYSIAE